MVKQGKKLSFRGKILCTYFLLICLTVIIFIICCIQGVSTSLSHHVDYMQQANEQKNINLDIAMGNHSSPNLLHFIDSRTNIILHEAVNELSAEKRYERNNYLSKTLRLLGITNPNIRRISILTKTGDFYSSVSQNTEEYVGMITGIEEEIVWKSRSQRYYTVPYPLKIGNSGYSVVTAICQMSDIGRNDNFAYLLLDLDFGAITEDFNSIINPGNMNSSFAIINDTDVIYNSRNACINLATELSEVEKSEVFQQFREKNHLEQSSGKVEISGIPCMVVVHRNESTGWYLVQYIPVKVLLNNSVASMIRVMVWVIGILLIAAALSLIFSKEMSEPIRKLSETMSQARQGRVRLYQEKNARTDEVGELIDSYNAMGQRINDSISQIYIAQLNQKQAELKMLQFQINPHFLYNALNTVTAIARLEEVEEIPVITESLSDMFRYNIKGDDFVALKEEVAQLQNYLRIQGVRFPGHFIAEFDIPEGLESCGVIKFILQPIVENSIHHAFTVKRSRDYLKISAGVVGKDGLEVSVYDDGCGMTEEKAEELNRSLRETRSDTILGEDGKGIGLANVNARIKNFYGQDYGISIESEAGQFTCIRIRLKIRK